VAVSPKAPQDRATPADPDAEGEAEPGGPEPLDSQAATPQEPEADPDLDPEVSPDGDQNAPDADQDATTDAAGSVEDAAEASRAWLTEGISALKPDNAGPGVAAFFDIDNTIMRGSSIVALAKGMADRDYFTTSEVVDFTWKQLKYVLSGRENMDDMAQATENGLLFVKGREPREIEDMAEQAYDERMVGRLWAGTVELAEAHKALGHEVWLVSATPVEVADVIARRLGLTGGLGTIAEVADGLYTGRLSGVPLHGAAKVEEIRRLAAERDLDLARCAAYSDSSNDIPMLLSVGCPVAINPDGALRSHAKTQGWPIRDYRIRGKESVRKGVPAAAAAGLVAGAAVGVAKGIAVYRGRSG
jgi:HAD superfamily hydrolase (TIGR01490 family)